MAKKTRPATAATKKTARAKNSPAARRRAESQEDPLHEPIEEPISEAVQGLHVHVPAKSRSTRPGVVGRTAEAVEAGDVREASRRSKLSRDVADRAAGENQVDGVNAGPRVVAVSARRLRDEGRRPAVRDAEVGTGTAAGRRGANQQANRDGVNRHTRDTARTAAARSLDDLDNDGVEDTDWPKTFYAKRKPSVTFPNGYEARQIKDAAEARRLNAKEWKTSPEGMTPDFPHGHQE